MAGENYQSYSSNNFLLDFSKEIIPVQLKVSETLNLQFNGYQYSFNSNKRTIGWTPGIKDLEFYFDFNSENLSKEISFLAKDVEKNKLKYLWGTTALLSFFVFVSNGNFTASTATNQAAFITAPANRPFKAVAAITAVEREKQKEESIIEKRNIEVSALPKQAYLEESFSEITLAINSDFENTAHPQDAIVLNTAVEESIVEHENVLLNDVKYIASKTNTRKETKVSAKINTSIASPKIVEKIAVQHTNKKEIKSISLATTLSETLSKAILENKQMIIGFGAKWCMPCKLMEETTYKDKAVQQYIEEHYVMLKIDVDDFDGFNLKQHYEVNLLPTFLVFDQHGKIKARYEESFSAKELLNVLVQNNSSGVSSDPMELLSTSDQEDLKPALPLTPAVEIIDVSLQKNRNGKMISKLKSNGRNWNYTSVQFQLESELVNQMQGEELLVKIVNTDTKELLSQVSVTNFGTSNKVQIAHPWQKHLAKNYSIQIFIKKADGTLSQLQKGSKSIISNYDLLI